MNFLKERRLDILNDIKSKKKMTESTEKDLQLAVKEFKNLFVASQTEEEKKDIK